MATVSASGDGVTINGHFGTAATEKRDGGSVVMAGNVAAGDPITVSKSNIDLGTGDDGFPWQAAGSLSREFLELFDWLRIQ